MLWKLNSTGSASHRLRAQLRLSQGSSSCMMNSTSSSRSSHSFFLLVASSVLSHQRHFVKNSARSYELLAELMNVILVENILYHPFYWKPRVLTLGSVGFFAFLECAHDFTSLHVNDISVIPCPQTVGMSHTTCCCQVMVDGAVLTSRVIIDRVHDIIPFLMVWLSYQPNQICLLVAIDQRRRLAASRSTSHLTQSEQPHSSISAKIRCISFWSLFIACSVQFASAICRAIQSFLSKSLWKVALPLGSEKLTLPMASLMRRIVFIIASLRIALLLVLVIIIIPPYIVSWLLGVQVKKLMLLHRITGRAVCRKSPQAYARRYPPILRPRPVGLSASHMRPPILHKGCPPLRPVDSRYAPSHTLPSLWPMLGCPIAEYSSPHSNGIRPGRVHSQTCCLAYGTV